MKTWIKYSALGLGCFVLGGVSVGVAASRLMTSYSLGSIGQNMFHDFRVTFERVASHDGVPKSPARMKEDETYKLSMLTITLGQAFGYIDDSAVRADAVRIAKLIDADPRLQGPATKELTQEATEARHCIIEKSSNPSAVVQCVRDSPSAVKSRESIARVR